MAAVEPMSANLCPHCNKAITELRGELLPVGKADESGMGRAAVLVCPHCGKILSAAFDHRFALRDIEDEVKKLDRKVGSIDRVVSDVAFKVSRLK